VHVAPDMPYFFDPLNWVIHCVSRVSPFINLCQNLSYSTIFQDNIAETLPMD